MLSCVGMHMCVYLCVFMYVCMHVCVYVHPHMHTIGCCKLESLRVLCSSVLYYILRVFVTK